MNLLLLGAGRPVGSVYSPTTDAAVSYLLSAGSGQYSDLVGEVPAVGGGLLGSWVPPVGSGTVVAPDDATRMAVESGTLRADGPGYLHCTALSGVSAPPLAVGIVAADPASVGYETAFGVGTAGATSTFAFVASAGANRWNLLDGGATHDTEWPIAYGVPTALLLFAKADGTVSVWCNGCPGADYSRTVTANAPTRATVGENPFSTGYPAFNGVVGPCLVRNGTPSASDVADLNRWLLDQAGLPRSGWVYFSFADQPSAGSATPRIYSSADGATGWTLRSTAYSDASNSFRDPSAVFWEPLNCWVLAHTKTAFTVPTRVFQLASGAPRAMGPWAFTPLRTVTVSTAASNVWAPDLLVDGSDLWCVFAADEDGAGQYDLRRTRSDGDLSTWDAADTVLTHGTIGHPVIDPSLYARPGGGFELWWKVSDDGSESASLGYGTLPTPGGVLTVVQSGTTDWLSLYAELHAMYPAAAGHDLFVEGPHVLTDSATGRRRLLFDVCDLTASTYLGLHDVIEGAGGFPSRSAVRLLSASLRHGCLVQV